MAICEYLPQISPGNNQLTPPPATLDEIVRSSVVTFSTDTLTLELPSPQLGDQDTLDYDRIYRESRGLEVNMYRESFWQQRNILELNFVALTTEQIDALLIFLQATLGKQVTYVDYNTWEWLGIIVNPFNAVQTIRGNNCYHNFTLSFRGERV